MNFTTSVGGVPHHPPTVTEAELCGVSSSPRFSHVPHPPPPCGMMLPLTSSVYFFVFLGLCTWWVLVLGLDPLLFSCLCSAGHLHCGTPDRTLSVPVPVLPGSRSPNDYYGKRHCWTFDAFCKIILERLGGPSLGPEHSVKFLLMLTDGSAGLWWGWGHCLCLDCIGHTVWREEVLASMEGAAVGEAEELLPCSKKVTHGLG